MQVQVCLTMELSASASLEQIEEQILQAGREGMRQALKKSVRAWEEQHRRCPRCGKQELRVEGSLKRMVAAVFGRVALGVRRFRCQGCLHRWCPAQGLLRTLSGQQITSALQEAAVLAGASWPYRHAAGVLERLCGSQISAETIRRLSMHRGEQRAQQQQQQADEAAAEPSALPVAPEQKAAEPIVALDGGWVPSREQRGGMEGKVAVLAACKEVRQPQPRPNPSELTWYELAKAARAGRRVGPAHPRARYVQRRYCATFASSAHLGRQAGHAARSMGLVPHVVLADGANWIKTEAGRHFPGATCILDWPHLWRTVRKAITQTALEQQQSSAWKQAQSKQIKKWLWRGKVELVIARLQSWNSSAKALKQALTYLHEQRDWIGDYEQWKEQGYPIGSGIIERAVAIVINRRMKKRGMRWKRGNATSLIALRVDLLNTDWSLSAAQRAFP